MPCKFGNFGISRPRFVGLQQVANLRLRQYGGLRHPHRPDRLLSFAKSLADFKINKIQRGCVTHCYVNEHKRTELLRRTTASGSVGFFIAEVSDLGCGGLLADRRNLIIATVHAQSEAQDSSLPGLPVYDNVVARRSSGAQLDSKCSAGVGMDTAQPYSGTTKVNLVHVEECAH